jgi:hypothetical protein
MKYLKTFEENENEPQVGDYVICTEHAYPNDELNNFLCTHIGIISAINFDTYAWSPIRYEVEFEELVPNFYAKNVRKFLKNEIVHWSKNKAELELILTVNKYNL